MWFITAGGATFAAWPLVYAAAFSGFYVALMLTLFALFFRPVGFDYRSKVADPRWRSAWDWGLFVGGTVPALVFGVAFGNLLQGVPFHFDADLRVYYTGSFFALLNPFALLAGVVSVAMLAMHGAALPADAHRRRRPGARAPRRRASPASVFVAAFAAARRLGSRRASTATGSSAMPAPKRRSIRSPKTRRAARPAHGSTTTRCIRG